MNINVNSLLMELFFWCFLIPFIFLGAMLFTQGLYGLVNDRLNLESLALFLSGSFLLSATAYVGHLHFKD